MPRNRSTRMPSHSTTQLPGRGPSHKVHRKLIQGTWAPRCQRGVWNRSHRGAWDRCQRDAWDRCQRGAWALRYHRGAWNRCQRGHMGAWALRCHMGAWVLRCHIYHITTVQPTHGHTDLLNVPLHLHLPLYLETKTRTKTRTRTKKMVQPRSLSTRELATISLPMPFAASLMIWGSSESS